MFDDEHDAILEVKKKGGSSFIDIHLTRLMIAYSKHYITTAMAGTTTKHTSSSFTYSEEEHFDLYLIVFEDILVLWASRRITSSLGPQERKHLC